MLPHLVSYTYVVNSNLHRVLAVDQKRKIGEVSAKGGWFIRIQIMLKREMGHLII